MPILLTGPSPDLLNDFANYLSNELGGSIVDSVTQWPDVIVATDVDTVRTHYETNQLLSIYINDNSSQQDSQYVQYSDYELCVQLPDDDREHLQWELLRLVTRARLPSPTLGPPTSHNNDNSPHLTMGPHTFFVSLTFPNPETIDNAPALMEDMCPDVDALEYRVDLLENRNDRFAVLHGMQTLRRYCREAVTRVPLLGDRLEDVMPMVYTVRTSEQAGTFDAHADEAGMFERLEWGLRGGVEVLDVESAWDEQKTDHLLHLAETRYASQILGSHHVVGETVSTEEAVGLFQQCAMDGRAHAAKVVLSIDKEDDDRVAYEAALIATELSDNPIPHIALVLGEVGQFSRIINFPFTPVTHEALPFVAAPGQMSASELMAARLLTKLIKPQQYCILGHNIAYSVSPQMQGAAFAACKLPYAYGSVDVPDVKTFFDSSLFDSDDFGGASVTIPHKQAVIPYVDVMSDAATAIGSVNTLIARQEYDDDEGFRRVLYGDNTDWKGIYNPLRRRGVNGPGRCLILGAGGTARAAAYVAQMLGLETLYWNRTPSKAKILAESFGGSVVEDIESIELVDVVLSTLPAASGFLLPEKLLVNKPIVFDVNYKPYTTPLLAQAESFDCKVVRGSEMLWEQGVAQFEMWTQRTAPYSVMKQVVLENCEETKLDENESNEGNDSSLVGAFE